jgi:hypothetical protein
VSLHVDTMIYCISYQRYCYKMYCLITSMKCQGCSKQLGGEYFKVTVLEDDMACECGKPWSCEDIIYCTKRCLNTNCYWELSGSKSKGELHAYDECNGCGHNLSFQVDVKAEQVGGISQRK